MFPDRIFFIDCKFDASYQPVNVRVNGPLYKYISCKIHWDEEMSGQFTSYINRYCLQLQLCIVERILQVEIWSE
jgi:hypothetical protein